MYTIHCIRYILLMQDLTLLVSILVSNERLRCSWPAGYRWKLSCCWLKTKEEEMGKAGESRDFKCQDPSTGRGLADMI